LQLLDVYLPQLLECPPIEQHVVILVVNIGAGDDRHLRAYLSLGLPLALLLVLLLALLLDPLDGLLELPVVLLFQLLLALVCTRLRCSLLVRR
jgi:hypothetical protein